MNNTITLITAMYGIAINNVVITLFLPASHTLHVGRQLPINKLYNIKKYISVSKHSINVNIIASK